MLKVCKAALFPALVLLLTAANWAIDNSGNIYKPDATTDANTFHPATSASFPNFNTGSVLYVDSLKAAAQGTNFIWDETNKSLIIGGPNPNAATQHIASLASVYTEIAVYGNAPADTADYTAIASDSINGYIYSNKQDIKVQSGTGKNVVLDPGGAAGPSSNVLTIAIDRVTSTKPIILPGYTVATLPAGTIGMIAYVTDQAAACVAPGAALTGGGAIKCPAFYNGAAWVGL